MTLPSLGERGHELRFEVAPCAGQGRGHDLNLAAQNCAMRLRTAQNCAVVIERKIALNPMFARQIWRAKKGGGSSVLNGEPMAGHLCASLFRTRKLAAENSAVRLSREVGEFTGECEGMACFHVN